MPCAMAVATSFQELGWEGTIAKARANQDFNKVFQSVRKQVVDRTFMKSWLEEEVEVCKVYGRRLESQSKFMTVTDFEKRWKVSPDEVCPTLVITVTDEFGQEVRGIPIAPDDPNPRGDTASLRTLTNFCDEFVIHKDNIICHISPI